MYDKWLADQVDRYMDHGPEHDEDSEDCECYGCEAERKQDAADQAGDHAYDCAREYRIFGR